MIGYVDCFSGVSGDMLLGGLVDAGLPLARLESELARLDVSGFRLDVAPRQDQGITGTQVSVRLDATEQPERRLADIEALLEGSALESAVASRALAVFQRLARAEARVHGVAPGEVHFHEVGALDAIVDVVGVVAGLAAMGVERLYASRLPLGGGTARASHGVLPLPAPGTLALLAEANAPTRPVETDRELVTPTGAALLTELATFEQPPLRIQRVGYGYGRRQLAWPNLLRLWLGEPLEAPIGKEEVALLEANLDDLTAEALGYAMERLLTAGALDVYFQPLQMKKNRPGTLLGVLARPAEVGKLAQLMLAETSTLGVRVSRLERFVAPRFVSTVETELGPVAVKVKQLGERLTVAPEYDDAARLAVERGVPLADVYRAVARAEPPAPPQS